MKSVNYTYEEFYIGEDLYFVIKDRNGIEIGRTTKEENAELIVAALNGVAP